MKKKVFILEERQLYGKDNEGRNYFNGMLDLTEGDNEKKRWTALYNFLETFFGEKNTLAANQWMYMGTYKWLGSDYGAKDTIFRIFKHGFTRKSVALLLSGQPCEFTYKDHKVGEYEVIGYEQVSFKETFERVYEDLFKYIESVCNQEGCEKKMPEEIYYMGYGEYKELRDQMLAKAGINVATISGEEDYDKLKDI